MKKTKTRPVDTLELVIRAATRVQKRLAEEGVDVHFTMTFGPLPPPDPKKLKRS